MKKDYVKPKLELFGICAEQGIAVSDNQNSDIYVDFGSVDDEFA